MEIFRTKSYKGTEISFNGHLGRTLFVFLFSCVRYQSVYLPAVGLVRSGRAISYLPTVYLISRMSPAQFEKYIFLTSFAEKIIHLSNNHESASQNQSHTVWDPNKPRQPDTQTPFAFGVQDGLLNLMERVFSLHILARETGILDSESIPQALAIWNDLEHLNPPETLDSSDSLSLHASCVSALFVWLYLVVHPEDMEEEKVQNTVYTGLVNAENVSDVELYPFSLIPAFCLGLASIRREDRDYVKDVFDKAERSGISKKFRETVNESWRRQDKGVKRSWDWGS